MSVVNEESLSIVLCKLKKPIIVLDSTFFLLLHKT